MRPQEIDQRAVRIRLLVGVLMVPPMGADPARRRVLHAADSKNGERVFQRLRADHAAMGQQPMKAKADSERAENVKPDEGENNAGPAEQPRHERQQSKKMHGEKTTGIDPSHTSRLGPHWQ